jgi:opacity protein-like surface antigen
MKALIAAIALAAGLAGPAAAASWAYPALDFLAQAKGRQERGGQGRDFRQERRGGDDRRLDDRRERLNDDERRQLHRDLDKANRELYHPRQR